MSEWQIVFDRDDPPRERLREALCTLGNGYFATRGSSTEALADEVHYPGTYLAGGYNRLASSIEGRRIENEDLVNLPNWLALTYRLEDGPWLNARDFELLEVRQVLELRSGTLRREVRWRDAAGRITRLHEERLVHMADPHLSALALTLTAENWSGRLTLRNALDGRVVNAGVARYAALANRHLEVLEADSPDDETLFLRTRTVQSRLEVAQALRIRVLTPAGAQVAQAAPVLEREHVAREVTVELAAAATVRVEKVHTIHCSRDRAISECGLAARQALHLAAGYDELRNAHAGAWERLWDSFDVRLELESGASCAEILRLVRLHVFHLLQTASPHAAELDAGVPARGWHGEAYRGHIFWDEIFIFPLLSWHLPEIARAILMYRVRRLPQARRNAADAGLRGALFPWQSGSDGREESQRLHLNPHSRRWLEDHTHLQRHINGAVAYNVWHYYQVTGDREFLASHGAEVLLEIARCIASLATLDETADRYEIRGVVGPDEFHTWVPGSSAPGLDNNTYTNVMAVWVLCRALEVMRHIPSGRARELGRRLSLDADELAHWEDISRRMRVVFHEDGVISQFQGYEALAEFDWKGWRARYGDIHRLDRLLEAEGDDVNRYKAGKQADVLMLFYLFSPAELHELFGRLGYSLTQDTIDRTIAYYAQRTSHGSTLSRVVHSWVMARHDRAGSWELFCQALRSDVDDIQGGTTAEGIHLGAMAATVDFLLRGYPGVTMREEMLWLEPSLPDGIESLSFGLQYRGRSLRLAVSHSTLVATLEDGDTRPMRIGAAGNIYRLEPGARLEIALGSYEAAGATEGAP